MWRLGKAVLFISFIALAWAGSQEELIFAQDHDLQGPILVTQFPYGSEQITFQDVSTGRVWEFAVPVDDYGDGLYHLVGWVPDGCQVLVYAEPIAVSPEQSPYALLTLPELNIEEFPSFGVPFWSLDGQSIHFEDHSNSGSTSIYRMVSETQHTELIHTFDNWVRLRQWLSGDKLIYDNGYQWFVWNLKTGQSWPMTPNPYDESPPGIQTGQFYDYSVDTMSPNREMRIGFYSRESYRMAVDTRIVELTEEEITAIEANEPYIPGFDLVFRTTNTAQHVDLAGQYVRSIAWSPSSRHIAITTDWEGSDFGIYVYDVAPDTFQRIANARGAIAGMYLPSWSPDGEWLAFWTPDGPFIQHVLNGERIMLDERMDGYQLFWSPIMDYSETPCGN